MAGSNTCPCRAGTTPALLYSACCQRFHDGELPQTAEQLMRSRYSAFALQKADYLLATHWPVDTSITARKELVASFSDTVWLSLAIEEAGDNEVQFTAKYIAQGGYGELRERSKFKCLSNKWYYLDGDIL